MTDREKLMALLDKSFEEQYEKRGLLTAQHTATDLLANGVTFAENATVGSEWISVSERLPTEEDANEFGCVLSAVKGEPTKAFHWTIVADYAEDFPYWMAIPKLPKEDVDE